MRRCDYTRPGVEPWWDTPRHDFESSFTGRVCDRMVLRDGYGDACGLPPEHPAHMYGTTEGN